MAPCPPRSAWCHRVVCCTWHVTLVPDGPGGSTGVIQCLGCCLLEGMVLWGVRKPQAKSNGMAKLSVQFSIWRSNTYFEWVFWGLSYFLSGDFCRCSAIMIERHFFQMGWKPHTQIRIFLANMKIPMVICIFFFNQSDTVWVDCTFSWYRNSMDNC